MKEKFIQKINENGSVIRVFVTTIVLTAILFGCFLANVSVPSGSMDPTIKVGDRLIANRIAYSGDKNVNRNDIIIFRYPDNEKKKFTKRVVGMPGEVISEINGTLYVNGKAKTESYVVNDHSSTCGPYYVPKAGDKVRIVDGEKDKEGNWISGQCYIGIYYVGDVETVKQYDADKMLDGGEPGFLETYCEKKDNDYYVKADCYFCMGDNRNNSLDSRYWANHYVVKEKIVGKVFCDVTAGFKKL